MENDLLQQTLPFHLALGNGWTVSSFAYSESPLQLCLFSGGNSYVGARLDLGKRIFIDKIPTPVNNDIMNTLITLIGWFSNE